MSSSASAPRNPFKNSFPSWRAQSLSKNSSPAALTFALAQPEHAAPLASAKSKLPDSLRSFALNNQEPLQEEVNSQLNDCEEQVLRPVPFRRSRRPVSECLIETSSFPLSERIKRAAQPAYMTVRGHKKTLPESPVAGTGWLSTRKGKGKERGAGQGQNERVETEPQVIKPKGKEEPIDVPNVDSSPPSSSKLRTEQVPTNIPSSTIPTAQFTSSSAAAADTSATQIARDSTPPHKPTNDNGASSKSTVSSAAPLDISPNLNPVSARNAQSTYLANEATSNQESLIDKHDQPSTLPQVSPAPQAPQPKAAAESSATGGSWFSASWLGWSDSTRHHGDLSTQRTDGDNHDGGHADNEISDGQEGKFHERGQLAPSMITVSRTQIDGDDSRTTPAISRGNEKAKSITADSQAVVFTPGPPERLPDGGNNANSTTGPTATGSGSAGRSPIGTCEPSGGNGATPSTCQPVPQDSRGPTTELETENRVTTAPTTTITNTTTSSWWDYVGWRSTPVGNVDATASENTGSGTGHCSSCMDKPVADDRKDERGVQESTNNKTNAKGDAQQVSTSVKITGESEGAVPAVQPPASPFLLFPTPSSINPPLPSHVGVSGPKDPRKSEQTSPDSGGRGSTEEDIPKGQDQVQAQTQGGSSWYNPWAWYGASYAPSVGTAHAGLEGSEKDAQDEKVEEVNAPAQDPVEVREGAPPQELHVQVSPPSPSVPGPESGEEVNPVAATIDSHRSSWISFFSSRTPRTLVMKSITGPGPDSSSAGEGSTNNVKVDENGMEVMDIDDETDSPLSFTGKEPEDPSKTKGESKEKESKALSTLSPSQGFVATLVRGRGRIRTQSRPEQDSPKEGNSETSSIRSAGGGQGSGGTTPVNGIAIPSKQGAEPPPPALGNAAIASPVPSSPSSTTSLVKRASLTLTSVGTKAAAGDTPNGNIIANTTSTATATDAATIITANGDKKPKSVSPTPSPTSKKPIGPPPPPNQVLPSWQDTFHTAPRSLVPQPEAGTLTKTMQYVSGLLFSGGRSGKSGGQAQGSARTDKGKRRANSTELEREREQEFAHFGKVLPRAWDVLESTQAAHLKGNVLRGSRRVVVIGVHGWFPGAVMRTVIGEPTGTSSKFANMMVQALEEFENEHSVKFDKITKIPLEGEGTIKRRIDKLYSNLLGNKEWMDDIQAADAILVATHSQGSVVSTHLLDRLVADKHIRTSRNSVVIGPATSFPAAAGMEMAPAPRAQHVCCLAMCGIHLGPLRYLSTSSLFQPYFQYLESPAARELFEFQNTDSEASKEYAKALGNVLSNGVKMLYVASLNDQVVPIYSGLFTAASHPLILRALYIDGDAYNSSDFLANLLVLLLRILNSGISDSGLLVHLSEATAGSLSGVGHSTVYEEIATYSLAVKYLFLSSDGYEEHPELVLDSFNARQEQNDYEIPWALRDVIADDSVTFFFSKEILQLRDAFRGWHPRTSILRDLKRKLQPIQRLPASFATSRL